MMTAVLSALAGLLILCWVIANDDVMSVGTALAVALLVNAVVRYLMGREAGSRKA